MSIKLEYTTVSGKSEETIDPTKYDLVLSGKFITDIDLTPLTKIEGLERLYLSGNQLEEIDLTPLSSCEELYMVSLARNRFSQIDLSSIHSSSNLEKLDLSHNKLTEIDLNPLASITSFLDIDLSLNRLQEVDLSPFISQNRLVVDLRRNVIQKISLPSCLRRVLLERNALRTIDLSPLISSTQVGFIELRHNILETIDLTPLRESTLWGLDLQRNRLTEIDLAPLSSCNELTQLNIGKNKLTDIDLGPLASCTSLKSLNLGGNYFTNIDLGPLASCTNLESLGFEDTLITSVDLNPLTSCTNLKSLDFIDSKVAYIDPTPLKLQDGLKFLVEYQLPVYSLLSQKKFSKSLNQYIIMHHVDAPSAEHYHLFDQLECDRIFELPTRRSILFYLPYVVKDEPSWKVIHLFHEFKRLLGFDWLGFIDVDDSIVESIMDRDRDHRWVKDKLFTLLIEQIENGGTTIGLDIDRMTLDSQLVGSVSQVLELRMKEMEHLAVTTKNHQILNEVDLHLLWFTAYGHRILKSLNFGTHCNMYEFQRVQQAAEIAGGKIRILKRRSYRFLPEMSKGLREYIWQIVNQREK